ncbi:hypothetical protein BGX20_006154 [Mortierella sp. AD010]|nr:hypothetical protein BGX20_006154 [Mortierella sp. AD010]
MLNIKDNCTLMDCLEEFVEPEELVGADRNNKWFVLNDEEVTEFHGTRFDPEDYSEIATKAKARKAAVKGGGEAEKFLNALSSRNAYMLTYVRRASELPIKPSSLPNETLEIVQQDNAKLEIEIKEYEEYKNKVKDDFDRLRDKRRELYRCWGVDSDEDNGYYVSSEALAKYIQSDSDLSQTLDNSSIACEHGKLCPSTVARSKRISKSAMQLLEVRDQIKVDPILTMEDFCDICIRKICQDKLYTLMHRRDIDEFERKAKGIRSPPAVWISKAWLTDWLKVSPRFHPENGTTVDDPSPLSKAYITDVLCQHSNLSIDKSRRKQINKAASLYDILALALGVLTRIFGEMSLPESNSVECSVCLDRSQPQRDNIIDMTSRAASEKFELSGMVMRGARFRHMEPRKNYYAVSKEGFMKKWLDFVKRPTVNVRPTAIDNSSLLCRHDRFVFDLNNEIDMENDNDLFVVNEEEWAILQAMYGGGPKILIPKTEAIQTDCEYTSTQSVTDSDPSLCSACRIERILDFSSTTLVIRVYASGKATDDNGGTTGGQTPTESPEAVSRVPPSNKLSKAKRKQAPPIPEGEFGARRSKRVKAVKKSYKEIKVPVSKHDTVMDLKLKIMQKTEIVPLYQKLLHEKVELENNDSTIADLKIPPNAILDLIAFDQSADELDLSNLQDVVSTPGDEGGFGGTGLTEDWQ